jgi:hypothetical protein
MNAAGHREYYCDCATTCYRRKKVSQATWYAHRQHRAADSACNVPVYIRSVRQVPSVHEQNMNDNGLKSVILCI